jgi:hypothetical protein
LSWNQFWAGVAATILVAILVAMGVPNLMRTRMSLYEAKRAGYAMHTSLELGGGGGGDRDGFIGALSVSGSEQDRQMIRTASMDLLVKSPRETCEKIRLLAEQAGGFLVSSEAYGGEDASSASCHTTLEVSPVCPQ